MSVRDRWVGWDDAARARNLQHVVNNSRFLLLPWVAVRNLASAVLARGLGRLVVDWPRRYRLAPWDRNTGEKQPDRESGRLTGVPRAAQRNDAGI